MPRVTKKEKEAGKGRPKPKGAYESKNPKSTGGREGGKKTGFKVGPAHAPRDAYLGKGSFYSYRTQRLRANENSPETESGFDPTCESEKELCEDFEGGGYGLKSTGS